jgi:hypothetical protein
MEPALLKSRSESPRNTNLRVHFKHPIEEDAMSTNNTCNIKKLGRIDPFIQMHAKEIIAAKLIEGFNIKGDGEKCQHCHMPLMVKDNAWGGMFCGQRWFDQNPKIGVCVVCPEPHDDDMDSNASSQDIIDEPKRKYEHHIPAFPDDDTSHDDVEEDYSRDSHDGSVGEFKKKFDLSSDMHIKKIEMNTEVDEICAKELKSSAAAVSSGSRNCPSCGMEMLDFGDDLECPFCALEVIKEELGIRGTEIIGAEDSLEERKQRKKEKRCDLNVEGLYLQDLVAVPSSCSTLSASVRFAEDGAINESHQNSKDVISPASLAKVPSDAGTVQLEINAILKRLRDDDEKDANNVSHPSDDNDGKAACETDSPHLAVNAVLKRLITGFWMENNEKTLQDSGTEEKEKVCDEPSAMTTKAEEMGDKTIDNVACNTEIPVHEEKSINEDMTSHEKSIGQQKSFNDDLHNKVKAFAAIVFGTKEEKTEMFKSNEIDVSADDIGEEGDSFNARSEEQKCNDTNGGEVGLENAPPESGQPTETEARTLTDDFSMVESLLFNEDMSTEEIFATLNEIEAVTKNILDLPVFSANGEGPFDIEHTISREDDETNYRDDEEIKRSTIDPPSVCSRDSRDPPNMCVNTYEPIDENLLLLRKDNLSTPSPDIRDPPTTISDKYQPRSEISFPETMSAVSFDRLPRDPSEHGGSLESDSFSQEDESCDRDVEDDKMHLTSRDLHQQSISTATIEELAAPTATSSIVAHLRLNALNAPNRERAEPVGTSSPMIDRSRAFYQRPLLAKRLKRAENSGIVNAQRRQLMEPESAPIPSKVNHATTVRAKDLYQRPEFLTKIVNEPESSRDAMMRQRLMQLNSRYHKLTSDRSEASQSESTTLLDSQLEARYQKFTSQRSGDVSSRVNQPKLNDQAIFREQRFAYDSIDLQQATLSSGVLSFGIKGTGSGLSPDAVARHAHYKKQLCAAEKGRLHSQCSNDSGGCLSTTAAERRQHYKEVLKEQMARQRSQVVTQE